jgi:hypothetical protein
MKADLNTTLAEVIRYEGGGGKKRTTQIIKVFSMCLLFKATSNVSCVMLYAYVACMEVGRLHSTNRYITNASSNTNIILFLDADSRAGNNVVYLIIIIKSYYLLYISYMMPKNS